MTARHLEKLVHAVERAFFYAYFAHANGLSETELLIDHDIQAAGCDAPKCEREILRRVISAAVSAVDIGMPFGDSKLCLMQSLQNDFDSILKENWSKTLSYYGLENA